MQLNFLILLGIYFLFSSVSFVNVKCQRPLFNQSIISIIPPSSHGNASSVLFTTQQNIAAQQYSSPTMTVQEEPLHPFEFDKEELYKSGNKDSSYHTDRVRDQMRPTGRRQGQQRQKYPPYSSLDSLRKELMKSNGGIGVVSDYSSGYSPRSTSSINVDITTHQSGVNKYADVNQLNPVYSTRLPSASLQQQVTKIKSDMNAGDKNKLSHLSGRKGSLNKIYTLTKSERFPQDEGQSDGPLHSGTADDIIDGYYGDPLQEIKARIKSSSPKYNPYESQTDNAQSNEIEDVLGVKCTFETECAWKWTEGSPDGLEVVSGALLSKKNITGMTPGPVADLKDDANGHFLYARLWPNTVQVNLTSPQFSTTMEKCFLEVWMHQSDMNLGLSRVVVEPLHSQESSWVPAEIVGDNFRHWERKVYRIGRISRDFRIAFEIVPKLKETQRGHVAIDNLRMVNCFPEGIKSEKCSTSQVKCLMNKVPVCILLPRICDINKDCDDAEDELLNCDKIPYGGRCDFENDWCGWRDSGKTVLSWSRHTGSSPTYDTGPDNDHTFQHLLNSSGYYMLVDMNQHFNNSEKGALIGFASNAIMISKIFNPPPSVHGDPNSLYRNSCVVRFYVHQFGKNPGSINFSVVEMKEKENKTTTLWWSSKNQGSDWLRAEYALPDITSKYYLQFEARMGMRIFSDVAVDDFSLSPECFGINIPKDHLNGYDYWDIRNNMKKTPHKDFEHRNYLELTTCDTRGMIGPTQHQCESSYRAGNKSHVLKEVRVVEDQSSYKGIQKWRVPNEGYYTIIAKGGSGGLGSAGVGSSRGAMSVAVLELHKNEELFILVGQQGENACIKSTEGVCQNENITTNQANLNSNVKQHMLKNMVIENGAGGGGGGTFVFLLNSAKNEAIPLVIASGGGGLGIGRYVDENFQHGQAAITTRKGVTGQIYGETVNKKTAGPGGGWRAKEDTALGSNYGAALLQGGRGGHSCFAERTARGNNEETINKHGQGGFGGGGGGCDTGGGGGGYAGGDVYLNETNGEGGTSYISSSRNVKNFNTILEAANSGPGSVVIIAAIEGCGCDYRCIALDEFRSITECICPDGWRLKKENSTACEVISDDQIPFQYLIFFFVVTIVLLGAALSSLILILYNRYQRKKQATLRHKMRLEQNLQLNRLRQNVDEGMAPDFVPFYGCDGILNGNIDVKSLPQVARESLRLVKALGQGAFGEVYQGLYRSRDGDVVEKPVAVKTLPEMSIPQDEVDFLMEAAIMAKFRHENIVRLIGVCFDRHPRFIVLELLAGGDLKNFLREERNRPERPSPLTMKDLICFGLDVAKGCQFMESKRFIHRDIAARNCLLSSKGPPRVVKIADFGMARDIYRSEYYRKGGKAILPIKWMPPEAFLDGIFTSKTDVWSFGVLLWEVFSMGLMPYTGLSNRDVMQLVTSGGRLDAPPGCPLIIYRFMAECWNPTPEERPSFGNLLERLMACTEDNELMSTLIANIFRLPTTDRDSMNMQTQADDRSHQAPQTSDYLIPLPDSRNSSERFSSKTATENEIGSKVVCTAPYVTSPSAPHNENSTGCWETSFIMPSSKSDQPLLSNSQHSTTGTISINEISTTNHSCNSEHSSSANSNRYQQQKQDNDVSASVSCSRIDNNDDTKLISLDTPQPTPTTIKPPITFSSQLDGITLDPSTLNKGHHHVTLAVSNQSYVNIQMVNPIKAMKNKNETPTPAEKMNGSTAAATSESLPFTIQGYSDHYNVKKENHSEISC